MSESPLIVDQLLPDHDAMIAKHLLVSADVHTTFEAARYLDFLTVHDPLVDSAFWLRGLPARLRREAPSSDTPPKLVLGSGEGLEGWLVLGVEPNREVAFGAIGKFWQPNIEWRDVPLDQFTSFSEAGYGKIAACFVALPYGDRRTILSYDCRVGTTDAGSRAKFLRYWELVKPVVGHVLNATLRTIRDNAERSAALPAMRAVR